MGEREDAEAVLERARGYAAAGRYGDAVASFDDVVNRFGATDDPQVDWLVGDALFGKAYSFHQVEREQQALAVYEQMAERYRGRADFRGQLSRALVQAGSTLARLDQPTAALDVWDELLESFSDVTEPPLAMGVAFAYEGKAAALRGLGRLDDAIAAYDELVVRFSGSRFPVLRRRVDAALSEKVFVLLLHRRYEEAIVVASAAVDRLGESDDPDALAIAVLNLGGGLASEGRFDEALRVYDTLIERLEQDESPELRGRLILAISNKVEALMVLDRGDDALALHEEMLERFGEEVPEAFADAAIRNEYDETAKALVAGLLLKEALVLAELEQKERALVAVDNLIERFGREQGEEFARVMAMATEFRAQLIDDD
jgi:tetratricopeptide (TPR) repeat protein